jgi:hypothetical protein
VAAAPKGRPRASTTRRDWVRRIASLAAGRLSGLGFALVCLGSAWAASPLRPAVFEPAPAAAPALAAATGQIWYVNNTLSDDPVGYWKFD